MHGALVGCDEIRFIYFTSNFSSKRFNSVIFPVCSSAPRGGDPSPPLGSGHKQSCSETMPFRNAVRATTPLGGAWRPPRTHPRRASRGAPPQNPPGEAAEGPQPYVCVVSGPGTDLSKLRMKRLITTLQHLSRCVTLTRVYGAQRHTFSVFVKVVRVPSPDPKATCSPNHTPRKPHKKFQYKKLRP